GVGVGRAGRRVDELGHRHALIGDQRLERPDLLGRVVVVEGLPVPGDQLDVLEAEAGQPLDAVLVRWDPLEWPDRRAEPPRALLLIAPGPGPRPGPPARRRWPGSARRGRSSGRSGRPATCWAR